MRRTARLLLFALLALTGCGADPMPSPDPPRPGHRLPAFDLPSIEQGRLSERDFAGRALVLNFWATWCAPCREEMPSLQRLDDVISSRGAAVIGISADSDANLVREFVLQYGVRFPIALDPKGIASREVFGVTAYPTTFLVRSDGTLAEIVVGPRQWDDPGTVSGLEKALGMESARR